MTSQTIPHNLTTIIDSMMAIDGARGAAIVDAQSGICLAENQASDQIGTAGAEGMSAATLQILAKMGRLMTETGNMEDLVSTFHGHQYVVRPLQGDFLEGLFLLLTVERSLNSDVLALARYRLMHLVFGLSVPAQEYETLSLDVSRSRGETYPFTTAGAAGYVSEQNSSLL